MYGHDAFIGFCTGCRCSIPYFSGWKLVFDGYGSKLVCKRDECAYRVHNMAMGKVEIPA